MLRSFIIGLSIALLQVQTGAGQIATQAEIDVCSFDDVYRVENSKALASSDLFQQLAAAPFILVGERHGIAEHPLFARCLLYKFSETSKTSVVLEMLPRTSQPVVDAFRLKHPDRVDSLGVALKWWKTGWPQWRNYQPLFDAGWISRSPLLGGDAAANTGPEEDSVSASFLAGDYSKISESWASSMREAHCGLISDERARDLGAHQVNRDHSMASVLKQASGPDGSTGASLLFAGRAHVRHDRSVPKHLVAMGILPSDIKTIGLYSKPSEAVSAGQKTNFETYKFEALSEARGKFDYVVFVGDSEEDSACSRLERLGLTGPKK